MVWKRCFRHPLGAERRLGRVFVQVDLVGLSNDFAVGIMPACAADVMRALQLTAVGAFGRIAGSQSIVRAALIAARRGDFILRDCHVLILNSV